MNQNNCSCGCEHPQLTMVPVQGFGLAMDLSGLKPAPVGRERGDHDLHIYIDGNRTESGDGLSPETAVKSYEDAVLALSRYDGCNTYSAHFHFADLADPEARYPDFGIYREHHATFSALNIVGASHETTMLGMCEALNGAVVNVRNVCVSFLSSYGTVMNVVDKLALKPTALRKLGIVASCSGILCFGKNVDVYLHPALYGTVLNAYLNSSIYNREVLRFHALGNINVETGFAVAQGACCIHLDNQTDFTDCASVTGRRYFSLDASCIRTSGLTLPGSLAGTVQSGGVFV